MHVPVLQELPVQLQELPMQLQEIKLRLRRVVNQPEIIEEIVEEYTLEMPKEETTPEPAK